MKLQECVNVAFPDQLTVALKQLLVKWPFPSPCPKEETALQKLMPQGLSRRRTSPKAPRFCLRDSNI